MTPVELGQATREVYNGVGDTFFSDSEIYTYIKHACTELATKAKVIERVYTASTVASTQEYSWPTYAISIKRITYEGTKLGFITFREDDSLTLNNQATTATGTPQYYALWNRVFYLRPIPSAVGTLKIFTNNTPQAITATSTLEIPEVFHLSTVNFALHRMFAKDKKWDLSKYFLDIWTKDLSDARAWKRKEKYGDSYPVVQNEDIGAVTLLGAV